MSNINQEQLDQALRYILTIMIPEMLVYSHFAKYVEKMVLRLITKQTTIKTKRYEGQKATCPCRLPPSLI